MIAETLYNVAKDLFGIFTKLDEARLNRTMRVADYFLFPWGCRVFAGIELTAANAGHPNGRYQFHFTEFYLLRKEKE